MTKKPFYYGLIRQFVLQYGLYSMLFVSQLQKSVGKNTVQLATTAAISTKGPLILITTERLAEFPLR